jgi:tol-pal system protein YbgF
MVAAPGDEDLSARVQVIETQIQALTGQIEHLTRQLTAIGAKLGVDAAAPPAATPSDQTGARPQKSGDVRLDLERPGTGTPGFGTVTVREDAKTAPAVPAPVESKPLAPAAAPAGGDRVAAIKAKALYEDAYGHLLRRDYAAAEVGFRNFLATYPSDALSGNAQYWLGETYYVRGKYSQAATAFLDGYKRYRTSDKAPDSLLKLGMALQQLGEKDAACATLGELKTKFPKAPSHIKKRAASERERAGC